MRRRGFLGALGAAIAGATLDPERALWEPGKKLISIPAPRVWPALNFGDVVTFAGIYAVNPVTREPLEVLKQFVYTGGNGERGLWPSRRFDGDWRNVAAPSGRFARVPDRVRFDARGNIAE